MNSHTKPFACGRCLACETSNCQSCDSPRGGCRCAECVPPVTPERLFSRAEVEALLTAQREAIASRIEDADDGVPLQCLADAVRATPLVEITTNKDKT